MKENDVTRNVATFAPVELGAEKPAFASIGAGGWKVRDLAGDGKPDLARFEGPVAGFLERNEEHGWDNFVPFRALPKVNWRDPNLRFVRERNQFRPVGAHLTSARVYQPRLEVARMPSEASAGLCNVHGSITKVSDAFRAY